MWGDFFSGSVPAPRSASDQNSSATERSTAYTVPWVTFLHVYFSVINKYFFFGLHLTFFKCTFQNHNGKRKAENNNIASSCCFNYILNCLEIYKIIV